MVIGIKGNQNRNYMQREERGFIIIFINNILQETSVSSQDQKFNLTFKIQITFHLSERGILVLGSWRLEKTNFRR
jgi:hypothetical protein